MHSIKRAKAWDAVAITIVAIMAVLSLMPLYWMVVTAITPPTLVMKLPPDLIPKNPTLRNFQDLFTRKLLGRWTLNSAIVSVTVTFAQLAVASLAGYAFAKKQFFAKNILFWLYVGSMMVPGQVTLIPRYLDGQDEAA